MQALSESIQRFLQTDDVWSVAFLQNVVLQSSSGENPASTEIASFFERYNTSKIHVRYTTAETPNEGPYFLNGGKLHPAYRLYPDHAGAFIVPTVPTADPFRSVGMHLHLRTSRLTHCTVTKL